MTLRRQPYPVAKITGGIDRSLDPSFIADTFARDANNIRFDQGIMRKDLGFANLGSGLPLKGTYVMWIDDFTLYNGVEYKLIATNDFVYTYASNTYTYRNQTVSAVAENLTFAVGATKTITRGANSWVTDGFTVGSIVDTNSANNAGPFIVTAVNATVLTVTGTMANEGPTSYIANAIKAFTGDEDDRFSGVSIPASNGAERYFLTNGKDTMQVGNCASNFADAANWSGIVPGCLGVFKNRLLAGATTESGTFCPCRVRWSIAGDPLDDTGTGSGFFDIIDTPDWVVNFASLKNRMFIVKQESLWELVYVGGTDIFEPELAVEGIGTYGPGTVASTGEAIILYSSDGVYAYDGHTTERISKGVDDLFYHPQRRIVNAGKINRSCSIFVEGLDEYWLSLPTVGDTPDKLFKYNFTEQAWTKSDEAATALGEYKAAAWTTWSSLSANWEDLDWDWLPSVLASEAPTVLKGTSAGLVQQNDWLTKTSKTFDYTSKDWTFAVAQRWSSVQLLARGGPFYVSYSLDRGNTYSNPEQIAASNAAEGDEYNEYSVWINKTSLTLRVKVTGTANDMDIKWIMPFYIARGRSNLVV